MSHPGGREPVVLNRIEIRRMPGFERGGFALDDLSPGVNIIFGPNGSGKTTTLRSILYLLAAAARDQAGRWEGTSLLGTFSWNGSTWTISVDPAGDQCQRDGSPTSDWPFSQKIPLDRYRFSLSELLQATEQGSDFAVHIIRETSGGYDLEAAARKLGFGQAPAGRQAAGERLRKAQQRRLALQRNTDQLRSEAERLKDLRHRRQEGLEARQKAAQLEVAMELLEQQGELRRLDQSLARFPGWLEHMTGQEAGDLDRLAELKDQLLQELDEAQDQVESARSDLAAINLPGDGVALHQLHAWRRECTDLQALEQNIAAAQSELAAARSAQAVEESRLGSDFDASKAGALDAAAIDTLSKLVHKQDELAAQRRELSARLRALVAGGDADPEPLREGVSLLSRWLSEPGDSQRGGMYPVVAAGLILSIITVVVGIAGIVSDSTGLLTFLVLAGTATGAFILYRWPVLGRRQPDIRERCQTAFQALNLPISPREWTPEEVSACLEQLSRHLQQAAAAQAMGQQRQLLEQELAAVREQEEQLDEEFHAWSARAGLPYDWGGKGLSWLVERLQEWQDYSVKVQSVAAAIEQTRRDLQDRLDRLAREWAPYGYGDLALVTSAQAMGVLAELEQRVRDWDDARKRLQRAEDRLERCRQELQRVEEQRVRIFQRLGLDPGDPGSEAVIRRAAGDLQEYRQIRQQRDFIVRSLAGIRERWSRLGADPALLEAPVADLVLQLESAREKAQRVEELAGEIGAIEARIEDAKQASALADALAEEDSAVYAIRLLFREHLRSGLGELLVRRLAAETRDSQRPRVFHRARDVFSRITNGRYHLTLDDSVASAPSFRAVQRDSGLGLALDQLSDGTRLQLLMAVRMAFVEEYEPGVRFPLLLDEVLANSDEIRSRAIMDTVAALAQTGRQVFYFTAQVDEVAKWQSLLDGMGLSCNLIDLEQARRRSLASRRPLPAPTWSGGPAVPEPGDCTYEEYGRLLQVPGVERFAASDDPEGLVDHVHLWHLLEDTGDLHLLLSLGVESWGALRGLAQAGFPRQWPDSVREIYAKAQVAARGLAVVLQSWRIGRGRPVDREALAASGAVSDRFLPEVSALADKLGGDAQAVIHALARGSVRHFRRDAIAQLEQYFEEHGYIDRRRRLDAGAILANALLSLHDELAAGRISRSLVERMVAIITS